MLVRLFSRPGVAASQTGEGAHRPQSVKELLATPRRQAMLKLLWDTTSLTRPVFDEYLLAPIERYAKLVQLLPASESHHHAYPGGMLDHALEMACYGLRLRQRHLLPPGAKPEDQSSAGELWSVAIIYAALMHDVAKALVDIEIHLEDGREWRLWHGTIPGPYRMRYRAGRDYHLHSAVNPLLAQQVLGARVLDWLMSQPRLFALLMYTISGHTERGGIIAELVHKADRASVARALGGDPVQALAAPTDSLQRKLAEGLRYLVREQFKLNQKGGVGWLTDDALWLVSPRAVNELKAHLYAQGIKSIPADLNRLYGELEAHGLIEEVSEGKAVWQCEIVDGDWQQTFSMVKVSPTLIWGVEGRPSEFSGTLTVQGAGTPEDQTPDQLGEPDSRRSTGNVPARAEEPDAPPVTDQTPPAQARTSISSTSEAPQKIPEAPRNTPAASLDEEIMDLFPEVEGRDSDKVIASDGQHSETEFSDIADTQCLSGSAKTEVSQIKAAQEPDNTSDLGEQFWQWLTTGLANHALVINDTKAPVHTVNGTWFLVSPGIFKRFSTEVLNDEAQWKTVQQRFQKLGRHVRTRGQNIHKVTVQGPNKTRTLMGYLIKDPYQVSRTLLPDNWVLTLATAPAEGEESHV
ncbi:TraI domain-containing protein [Halomonas sp. McH1-25]|uniref:MobH family relaxase n=1 Tax=unclassified Halomonas TaxID=2609666 RepID=UPI001EF3ED7F|nr:MULTISPECIES: MobH family relaxase [unclassified Halomonas]MCG7601845.1 TraI domain-containing protein [Halomonas sp. McH1-25]MCP1343524.1 TraI domain-containing protein [Halomonas sp. FL8]MCP1361640.1 TraI domain-containing protein [Halomonas sp. BBD45]